ncbi:MAG: IS21 family transposase [Streptosporangiaceae bacterium]
MIFPVERLEVAGMVFREVSVIEIREVLRAWLAGKSERAVAVQAGVDRKTSRRYVAAAVAAGLSRDGGEGQLTDELIGQVVSVVRPVRPDGHGQGWAELEARREQIAGWVKAEVPVVKIGILLARQGVVVAERTLHRFAAERCGAGGAKVTTPVDDGPPGGELQIDFGYLGLIPAGEGRRRKLHALVFTACLSRYMFVYLTFSMTLEEVIAGCEDAWAFFGGVFAVVVPDNMSPVVARADAVNPRLTREWLEYAQARGFVTDPARVRHPRDKPRVEAGVAYVQGNFFAGESFLDLADSRSKMAGWLAVANGRVHGTTRQVPAAVFAALEAPALRPAPAGRYRVPYWAQVKVHVDYHIQVARALYSVPWRHVGARVTARADEYLVKVYLRDQLIKTHPRQHPGGRSTDVADMPPGVEGYATRTVDRMVDQAGCYGEHVGIYARRLLDGDAPWMMMRSVYRLVGLAKRYGPAAAEAACARALDVDVVNVSKIESMLKNATENTAAAPAAVPAGTGRFARDPAEYATATGVRLQVVDGGSRP